MEADRIVVDRRHGAWPGQQTFLRNLLTDSYADGLFGGYGAGKTKILTFASIVCAALNPGCSSALVAPTYRMLKDFTLPALEDNLKANNIPYEHRKTDWVIYLPWWDHKILLRSGDDPDKLRGGNLAGGGVDEPGLQSVRVWEQILARVRDPNAKHLMRWTTGTPEGFDWGYDYFGVGRRGYTAARAPTVENKAILPSYAAELRESLDEAHAQAYLEGRWVSLYQRQVYYNFDRNLHVPEGGCSYDPELPLYFSHDFNVNPMCSVIFQAPSINHRRRIRVIDEIVLPHSNTPEVCKEFLARYGDHSGLVFVGGDPSARARDTRQESSRSDFDIIEDELRRSMKFAIVERLVDNQAPSLKRRHNTANALLKSATGDVSLLIDPRCKGLITSFERTVRKEGSQIVDKSTEWRWKHHRFVGVEHPTDALTYPLCKLFRDPRDIRHSTPEAS